MKGIKIYLCDILTESFIKSKVELLSNGCWFWTGAIKKSSGYGELCAEGRGWDAHRLSYKVFIGDIPKGLCVLHKCDNRWCVNPDHLFLGTKGDNNKDRAAKGRSCRGITRPLAKLTEADIIAIRASKDPSRKCAKMFRVGKTTILNIRKGLTWRHI